MYCIYLHPTKEKDTNRKRDRGKERGRGKSIFVQYDCLLHIFRINPEYFAKQKHSTSRDPNNFNKTNCHLMRDRNDVISTDVGISLRINSKQQTKKTNQENFPEADSPEHGANLLHEFCDFMLCSWIKSIQTDYIANILALIIIIALFWSDGREIEKRRANTITKLTFSNITDFICINSVVEQSNKYLFAFMLIIQWKWNEMENEKCTSATKSTPWWVSKVKTAQQKCNSIGQTETFPPN